jgi:tetratricopeptide (TPR) repeat protein
MPTGTNIVKLGLLSLIVLFLTNNATAQVTASQARQYIADKNYDKAFDAYTELYGLSPDSVYVEYLTALLTAKKYPKAEKLVEKQMTLRDNPFLHIDMGRVYAKEGKDAKAKEEYELLLKRINGDDMFTQRLAKAFHDANLDEYAILTYEKATQIINIPYYYSQPLATLYAKTGNVEKAVEVLVLGTPNPYIPVENVKAMMLEILGSDPEKLQQAQRALVKKINAQPENVYYAELLTWIYTQKNDWDGALIQMEAIDERNNESGKRLMDLARTAMAAKQYDIAVKAYDDIIVKGKESPYYMNARSEKLAASLTQIKNSPTFKPEDVNALAKLYDSFLVEFPKYYCMQMASDFALLEAQYHNNVKKAITILKKGIAEPDTRRNMVGVFKLQLADYYVLTGNLWEASLTYSQVDKEFKQDAFGEDARFRNAKLAYYRGDFDWAQRQLTILKSATSELIANDAIYLSVLITENVQDSNLAPLQRFAYVGLLLFQNKDSEAETLLDSINKAYPEHPLNDDILMLRADLAKKHGEFDKALAYLKKIYDDYGKDVLGDDAVFKMAEIYQNDLHKNDLAKHFYEQLIIDYQGSTFVQTARQRLQELNNANTP